jgi:uncharacterized protein with PIN domain
MQIITDAHIAPGVVTALRGENIDTVPVADVLAQSADDEEILAYARSSDRVILTNDRDFLSIEDHPGVLFYDRTANPGRVAIAVRNIEDAIDTMVDTTLYIPGQWA